MKAKGLMMAAALLMSAGAFAQSAKQEPLKANNNAQVSAGADGQQAAASAAVSSQTAINTGAALHNVAETGSQLETQAVQAVKPVARQVKQIKETGVPLNANAAARSALKIQAAPVKVNTRLAGAAGVTGIL